MPKHDTNHFHAELGCRANFFMVADLVQCSLESRGIPYIPTYFRHGDRFALLVRTHVGTKQQSSLSIRCHPLEPGGEIQNLAVQEITGPLDEETLATVREMMVRFGARWSVRDYYSAVLLENEKIAKSRTPTYVPTETIRATVELAGIVPFDELANYVDLVRDREKSAAVANVISKYGPALSSERLAGGTIGPRV